MFFGTFCSTDVLPPSPECIVPGCYVSGHFVCAPILPSVPGDKEETCRDIARKPIALMNYPPYNTIWQLGFGCLMLVSGKLVKSPNSEVGNVYIAKREASSSWTMFAGLWAMFLIALKMRKLTAQRVKSVARWMRLVVQRGTSGSQRVIKKSS